MLFIAPSGVITQSSVAKQASASSASTPAEAMAICFFRSASFQVSLVSVYRKGHITRKASPIAGTRTP